MSEFAPRVDLVAEAKNHIAFLSEVDKTSLLHESQVILNAIRRSVGLVSFSKVQALQREKSVLIFIILCDTQKNCHKICYTHTFVKKRSRKRNPRGIGPTIKFRILEEVVPSYLQRTVLPVSKYHRHQHGRFFWFVFSICLQI